MFEPLLLAAAAATDSSRGVGASRATATVRVLQSARAGREEWDRLPLHKRREVIRIESGKPVLIRVVDHE